MRNVTLVFDLFTQIALKRWFAGEVIASCKKSELLNPYAGDKFTTGSRINALRMRRDYCHV